MKLPVFIAGMLVAKLVIDGFDVRIAIFAMIAANLTITDYSWRYDLTRIVLTAIIFVCGRPPSSFSDRLIHKTFSHKFFRLAGEVSYGVYLIHLIVMYACFYVLIPAFSDQRVLLFLATLLITTVVGYAMAYALHVAVEKPGIEFGRTMLSRK